VPFTFPVIVAPEHTEQQKAIKLSNATNLVCKSMGYPFGLYQAGFYRYRTFLASAMNSMTPKMADAFQAGGYRFGLPHVLAPLLAF
jgi:hypothetical protein